MIYSGYQTLEVITLMFTSDLVAPVIEPITGRYDRDWKHVNDDRKVRGLDYQSEERRDREYVDPDNVDVTVTAGSAAPFTGQVDTDVEVTGTVVVRHDREPAGFDRNAFEADLVYDPNA